MLSLGPFARRARSETGFTLVETLVAVVTGMVVTLALFAILEVSLHQTSRLTDVAQASQLGRTTMTHVVDELHSACIASGFTPVEEGSNAKELFFVDAFSQEAEIPSEKARQDKIVWNEGAKTVTDFTYPAISSSTWPNFTFATTPSPSTGVRIGENVTQRENAKAERQPIFSYYKYAGAASAGTSATGGSALEEIKLKEGESLTTKQAEATASVAINYKTTPPTASESGTSSLRSETSEDLTDQVTFAFSVPNSEATIVDAPCK